MATNCRLLSRKVKISVVDMVINLQFLVSCVWENGTYTDGQNWQKRSYDRGFNDATWIAEALDIV